MLMEPVISLILFLECTFSHTFSAVRILRVETIKRQELLVIH